MSRFMAQTAHSHQGAIRMFFLHLQFLLETVSSPFMYLLCHKYAAGSLHLSYTTASTRWRHLLSVESMRSDLRCFGASLSSFHSVLLLTRWQLKTLSVTLILLFFSSRLAPSHAPLRVSRTKSANSPSQPTAGPKPTPTLTAW